MGKFYDKFKANLNRYGFEPYYVALVIMYFCFVWIPIHWSEWQLVAGFLIAFLPFVLPTLLGIMLATGWLEYRREQYYWLQEQCVLEVRLPEEITQSPYAMELVLRAMYQTGEVDTPAHEWRGNTRPWFSLELVSTEGQVRFYIWMRAKYKEVIKAQLYAHYPTVQVVEVPDYTLGVDWNSGDYDMFGVLQALQKPDPYPIATYIEQGMNKPDMKEEFKSDPMISLLEYFGSMGPGEHAWMQIIIRGHTSCYWSADESNAKVCHHEHLKLEKWAELEIDEIGKKYVDKTPDGKSVPNFSRIPEGDKDAIKAISQKINKQIFDVGIRTAYIARKEAWKGGLRNSGVPTAFRSFEHGSDGRGLNGFKPIFFIGPFNVPWHDFMGLRRAGLKKKFFEGYVSRQYFYPPHQDFHLALNSEEIATVYHFPGKVAHTPNLIRMPSRRAEAPANLPV
jgi:hypothetical protein